MGYEVQFLGLWRFLGLGNGYSWSPYDSRAQAKYEKGRANAEVAVAKAALKAQELELVKSHSTAVDI